MRKKTICIILIAVMMLISSCGPAPAQPKQSPEGVISIYAEPDEINPIIKKFIELHPDFRYAFSASFVSHTAYTPLDSYLFEDKGAPDIYFVGSTPGTRDVAKFTKGGMSGYAMSYKELGIDVSNEIAAAGIAQYIVDTGTRTGDNAVVGLSFKTEAGAFVYRRSIAKEVWGTDDPAAVASKIGPGWDKFFGAARDLKEKGYAILSGSSDIWYTIANSADKDWIRDGRLYIDPKREAFLDLNKELIQKGYVNTQNQIDGWEMPVFGFLGSVHAVNRVINSSSNANEDLYNIFGTSGDWAVCEPPVSFFWGGDEWVLVNKEVANDPKKKAAVAELIEWMTLDCTEDGLQYNLANGSVVNWKETVASGTVMAASDGTLPVLSGQDMFDVYLSASQKITGSIPECDPNEDREDKYNIGTYWLNYADKYANGECTREEAIAAFKQEVKEQLGIDAW